MNRCSIPPLCKELRSCLAAGAPGQGVTLGCVKHNETANRCMTTYQEKSCHLDMCTSKDYPTTKIFFTVLKGRSEETTVLPTIHPVLPCRDSKNRVRLGRKRDGFWAAPLGFQRRSDGSKQSSDPETALNISHPSPTGTRY